MDEKTIKNPSSSIGEKFSLKIITDNIAARIGSKAVSIPANDDEIQLRLAIYIKYAMAVPKITTITT